MALEDIREQKTSKWVYVVIGFLLVGMAGFGTSQFGLGGGVATGAVMTAGEAEISQVEYENTLRNVQQRNPDMDAAAAQQLTLSSLQQRLALMDYVNRYPLATDNVAIDDYIRENPAFFDNGQFSEAQFRRVIRVSPEVYRQGLSQDLALQKLQQTLAETAVVSQAEISPYTQMSGLSRDVLVAKIAHQLFENTASEEEISRFYDEHKAQYMTEELVNIEYIDFNPQAIADTMEVSEQEIMAAAAPQRQASYYLFTDKTQAQQVYEAVKSGETLDEVIKNKPSVIEDSGDLGLVAKQADENALIPQPAIDAIYALANQGDLTSPLMVDEAVYLFELTDKGSTEISETQKVAAKQQQQVIKAQPLVAELQEKLNKAVFESGTPSLESIQEQTGLPLTESGLQELNSDQAILSLPQVRTAIAESDKQIGKLQTPITIGERVVIYRLTQVKAPEQKTLAAVKSLIEQAVITEKTQKQVESAADQLVAAAKENTLAAAAAVAGYPTQAIEDFKGQVADDAMIDPIGAILIAQQSPTLGDEKAQKLISPLGDAYVVVSTAIRLGEQTLETAENTEAITQMQQQLAQQLGGLELSSFIQSISERTPVKVKNHLIGQ